MLLCLLVFSGGCGEDRGSEVAHSPGQELALEVPAENGIQQAGGPVRGGRMVWGISADAANLLWPLSTDNISHELVDLFLSVSLLRYDKDLNIEPFAAEKFDILDGGRRLVFTLKPGILWDDGVELTAEDVAFTHALMTVPETPPAYSEDFAAVASLEVLDRYRLEVRYDQPFARSLITWMHGILPRHVLEEHKGAALAHSPLGRKPLSAGRYRLVEWSSGERLVFEPRDDYFEGRPFLDQVVVRIIPDQSTQFLELTTGRLDRMALTPQQYLYQARGDEFQRQFQTYQYLDFGYAYLGYNLRNPLFSERKVRQALAHALDKQEIIQGTLLGEGKPTIGPYKPGTWVYNSAIEDYLYDPATALRLFAEAGWSDSDGDGVLDKDGKPFAFTILTNLGNEARIGTATIIQRRLKDVGVQVSIRTLEWAALIKEYIDKGRFEALVLGWNILQDPDLYDVWHSSKIHEGGLNFMGFNNPEADDLLERGRRTLDQEERKRIYDNLQEILHEEQPYCFLYVPYKLPVLSARIQGVELAPIGIDHNLTRWWIPADQQRPRLEP